MGITRIRGVMTITTSFQKWARWTSTNNLGIAYLPQGQALGSHMVDGKCSVHLDTPTMIGLIIGGRAHRKPSARNLGSHPSKYYSGFR